MSTTKPPDPVIEALAAPTLLELQKREVIQLAFWPDRDRAMPTDFVACAIFSASKRTDHVTRAELASINGLTVIFTGKRLTQAHADVWMGIMHLARGRRAGECVRFRDRQLLELIGRHTHKGQRRDLLGWLSQLTAAEVIIQQDAKRVRFCESLLPRRQEQDTDGGTVHVVEITPALARLLADDKLPLVDWEVRRGLKQKSLVLWLQLYFACFRRPVRVDQLHQLSGSTAKLKMFRYHLARALDELHEAGGFSAILDRETDTVRAADRPPPRKRREPVEDRQLHLRLVR